MFTLDEVRKKIEPIAKKYGVQRVFLFGSYARGEATEKSDLDFRIDKGRIKGIQFYGFFSDVEESFGKHIDIVTTNSLEPKFLENIQQEGEVLLYEDEQ